MKIFDLTFIGRGSAFTPGEVNNSAYVILGDTLILLDCGGDVCKKIIDHKILFQDGVKRVLILITHMHDDHVGSLISLLEYCKYRNHAGHIEGVFIYDTIKDLVQGVPAAPNKSRTETYLNIFDMSFVGLPKLRVVDDTFIENNFDLKIYKHYANHGSLLAYSYELVHDDQHIYFSGDTRTHDLIKLFNANSRGDTFRFYLECSTVADKYRGVPHFPESELPKLLNELSKRAKEYGINYSVGLMHIDEFDTYTEVSKNLIVKTIDNK